MSSAEAKLQRIRGILANIEIELEAAKDTLRGTSKSQCCGDCARWSGVCGRGKIGKTASDQSCESFEPKESGSWST